MADQRQQIPDQVVKSASTAAAATDPSLVVALSPNSPLPAGSNVGLIDAIGNKALFSVKGEQQVSAASLDTIATLLMQLIIEAKKHTFILSSMSNIWIDDSETPTDQLFQ